MNTSMIKKLIVGTLSVSILAAGCAYAAPAEPEVKTFGSEDGSTAKFEFVNGTGKDIAYFNISIDDGTDQEAEEVKMIQEALIEQGILNDVADGQFGPNTEAAVKEFCEKNGLSAEEVTNEELLAQLYADYDDGNILKDDETFKADETVIIYYQDAEDDADADEADGADEFLLNEEYIVTFCLAEDEETEYILHTIPIEETSIRILIEEDIPYIEYKAAGSENVVSTLETEKAIRTPAPQYEEPITVPVYDDGFYDDGFADFSSDYEPVQEPAAGEPVPEPVAPEPVPEPAASEPVQENTAQGADGCIDLEEALVN